MTGYEMPRYRQIYRQILQLAVDHGLSTFISIDVTSIVRCSSGMPLTRCRMMNWSPERVAPCPLRYDFLLGGTPWAQVRIISFRSSTQLAPRSEKGDTKPIVLLSKGHHRRFFLYGGLTPGTLQITRGRVSSASENRCVA